MSLLSNLLNTLQDAYTLTSDKPYSASKLSDNVLSHLLIMFPDTQVRHTLQLIDHTTILVFRNPSMIPKLAILIPSSIFTLPDDPCPVWPTVDLSYTVIDQWLQCVCQCVRAGIQASIVQNTTPKRPSHLQNQCCWGDLPAVCLVNAQDCSCPQFLTNVIHSNTHLLCSHTLAVHLALISNQAIIIDIPEPCAFELYFHWMSGTGVFQSLLGGVA